MYSTVIGKPSSIVLLSSIETVDIGNCQTLVNMLPHIFDMVKPTDSAIRYVIKKYRVYIMPKACFFNTIITVILILLSLLL